jgi:hypothetical protein
MPAGAGRALALPALGDQCRSGFMASYDASQYSVSRVQALTSAPFGARPHLESCIAQDLNTNDTDQDIKGTRWMPWRWKPMKDVASCDKPRVGAHYRQSEDFRMGKPNWGHAQLPPAEHIGRREATGGTETSKYPEEEKSTEISLVVASERETA